MQFYTLFSIAFIGLISAQDLIDADVQFISKKCSCQCDCRAENNCKIELYVVMDASETEDWGAMKLRVDEIARKLNKNFPIGVNSRISVITYELVEKICRKTVGTKKILKGLRVEHFIKFYTTRIIQPWFKI